GEDAGAVNALVHGATQEQVVEALVGSPEFAAHATALFHSGNSDADFVDALYSLLLARTPGTGELNLWLSLLPSQGRVGVAALIPQSAEYRGDVVQPLFTSLLHRTTPPSQTDVNVWVNSGLDFLNIELGFASSPEFFANG